MAHQVADNYYKVLQVDPAADIDVIRASYRFLIKKYHGDAHGQHADDERAKAINNAWATLSNPTLRAKHDQHLSASAQPEPIIDMSEFEQQFTFESVSQPQVNQYANQGVSVKLEISKKSYPRWVRGSFSDSPWLDGFLVSILVVLVANFVYHMGVPRPFREYGIWNLPSSIPLKVSFLIIGPASFLIFSLLLGGLSRYNGPRIIPEDASWFTKHPWAMGFLVSFPCAIVLYLGGAEFFAATRYLGWFGGEPFVGEIAAVGDEIWLLGPLVWLGLALWFKANRKKYLCGRENTLSFRNPILSGFFWGIPFSIVLLDFTALVFFFVSMSGIITDNLEISMRHWDVYLPAVFVIAWSVLTLGFTVRRRIYRKAA
jgi:hypothetical protein